MCLRLTLAKWRALDGESRRLLWESVLFLLLADFLLWFVPFGRIAPSAGKLATRAPEGAPAHPRERTILRIGWAVRAAARRMPLPTRCLPQALAAKWMLNRRRLPGVLFLGVATGTAPGRKMDAHAWVKSGDACLTGEGGHERFTVLGMFM